jgi:methyl-accepting chemotaxis protein PixJ
MIPLLSSSIILISYIGLLNFTKSVQSEIINELKIVAFNLIDKLSRQMFERTADVQFLSTNNILTNPNFTLPQKMDYLRSMERAVKGYTSISMYNKNGIKIGDTRNILIGTNGSKETFFKGALKGHVYYDPLHIFSESFKKYVIHFSAPLYNKNKILMGFVVATYPVDKINDIFKKLIPPENNLNPEFNSINVELVSRNGTEVYSNYDIKSILQKKPEIQNLILKNRNQNNSYSLNNNLKSNIINGKEIFVSVSQGNGYLDYKGSGWILILRENTDALFGDLQKIVNQFLIAAGIIVIISVILILLIARNISLPLSKLMDKVIELGKGNYNSKIEISSSDEIGKLAAN